ncbi:MAG: hypothetical protein ABIF40_04525 [archaeon]
MAKQLIEKYNLQEYIEEPEDRLSEVSYLLLDRAIEGEPYGIEAKARNLLLDQRAELTYPTIRPDFLKKSKIEKIRRVWCKGNNLLETFIEINIKLPVLAVYNLKTSNLRLCLEYGGSVFDKVETSKIKSLNINSRRFDPTLPEILSTQLNATISLSYTIQAKKKRSDNLNGILDFLAEHHGAYETTFTSLIPQLVKEDIKKAERIFEDQIYIIAEAEWYSTNPSLRLREVEDPLVLGVRRNKVFLISPFDTTPLEKAILSQNDRTFN